MKNFVKCLYAILFILNPLLTNAENLNYECNYKNLGGTTNKVSFEFNKSKTNVLIKNSNSENLYKVNKIANDKIYIEYKDSSAFKNVYEINENKLELKYDLHLLTLNKVNHFIGSCEPYNNNYKKVEIVKKVSNEDVCKAVSKLASKIMENRQAGVPLSTVMEIAKNSSTKLIVIKAYEFPHLSTKENIKKATEDFRDEWYLKCIKETYQNP